MYENIHWYVLFNLSLCSALLHRIAVNPCQKYISVDATKPVQLSVKQDGAVDVFEMQVLAEIWPAVKCDEEMGGIPPSATSTAVVTAMRRTLMCERFYDR